MAAVETTRATRSTAIATLRAELAAAFPNAIAPSDGTKRPLSLGIRHQIRERLPDIDGDLLAAMLTDYCSRPSYLAALAEGAVRVDLDGQPAGHVDAGAAAHANARRNAILDGRRRRARIAELENALDALLQAISDDEIAAGANRRGRGRGSLFSARLREAANVAETALAKLSTSARRAA